MKTIPTPGPGPHPSRQNRRASDQPGWRSGGLYDSRTVFIALGVTGLVLAGGLAWYLSSTTSAHDGSPSWSPDGQTLVYVTVEDAGPELFRMSREGGDQRSLAEVSISGGGPDVSPDGTHVAFDSNRDGNSEIYVVDQNGQQLRRLTNDPARDWAPDWSPDGTELVFMSDRDARPGFDVYRMKADGSAVERLTHTGTSGFPRYAPDGLSLALQVGNDVHVLTLSDLRTRRLTFDPQDGMRPVWAPSGQQIIFVSRRRGRPELFTMGRDGSDPTVLVSMPRGGAVDPQSSPDGTHVAFVYVPAAEPAPAVDARAAHVIYTVELGSGRLTRLSR